MITTQSIRSNITVEKTQRIVIKAQMSDTALLGAVEAANGGPEIRYIDSFGHSIVAKKLDTDFTVVRVDPSTKEQAFVARGSAGDFLLETRILIDGGTMPKFVSVHTISEFNGTLWYDRLQSLHRIHEALGNQKRS